MDDQLRAGGQLAGEVTVDFCDVDRDVSLERAGLRDLHRLAVDRGFDLAFDDEHVAVGNLDALELDLRTDPKLASRRIGADRRDLRVSLFVRRVGRRIRHCNVVAQDGRGGRRDARIGRELLRTG